MSKRQNSHSVRAAALCCSQRARNVISPLSPLGRIARIADSNCPSQPRELHKIPLWRRDAVRLRDLRSEIDWFRFLRLFEAGGLIPDETRPYPLKLRVLSTIFTSVRSDDECNGDFTSTTDGGSLLRVRLRESPAAEKRQRGLKRFRLPRLAGQRRK